MRTKCLEGLRWSDENSRRFFRAARLAFLENIHLSLNMLANLLSTNVFSAGQISLRS
jgi:hypothetical protein